MKKTLFISAAVVLVLAFVVGMLAFKSEKVDQSTQLAETNREHLVRMHSPTMGNADAPVVIVEFLDPACETCRVFYPMVKEIMAAHPGKTRLVLRYAPFHTGSDKVVAMLEAARKQNQFWPALEALLATQSQWVINHTAQADLAWQQLQGLGLNLEQMQADMATPAVASVIAQDLADAKALDVTKTPGFFVNGKPLTPFGYEPLKALVNDAVLSAQR